MIFRFSGFKSPPITMAKLGRAILDTRSITGVNSIYGGIFSLMALINQNVSLPPHPLLSATLSPQREANPGSTSVCFINAGAGKSASCG